MEKRVFLSLGRKNNSINLPYPHCHFCCKEGRENDYLVEGNGIDMNSFAHIIFGGGLSRKIVSRTEL